MKSFTDRFYNAMENQLTEITLGGDSQAEQYRASIMVCKKAMTKLKNYVSSYAFESVAEEIFFFKETKPQFYSKYIYFVNVYKFLMQKPAGGEEVQRAYINFHLAGLQAFFDNNKAFYQYFRSGGTQMDEIYFTRGGFAVQMELEDFEEDELYSTSHDYKLSKIIANEWYQDYLNLELIRLSAESNLNPENVLPFKRHHWTAGKTDAVELIYALKANKTIDDGQIEISELVTIFEYIFQVDLRSSYHKFTDITRRKKEITVFLDKLKDSLLRYIEDKLE